MVLDADSSRLLPKTLEGVFNGNYEFQKRALDKLAVKVHQMYNKVFQATMLSVRPSKKPSDGQREVSFFQSIDHCEYSGRLGRQQNIVNIQLTSLVILFKSFFLKYFCMITCLFISLHLPY